MRTGLFLALAVLLTLPAKADFADTQVTDLTADCASGGYVLMDGAYLCRQPMVSATLRNGTRSTSYVAFFGYNADLTGFCVAMGFKSAREAKYDLLDKVSDRGAGRSYGLNSLATLNQDGTLSSVTPMDISTEDPMVQTQVTCR